MSSIIRALSQPDRKDKARRHSEPVSVAEDALSDRPAGLAKGDIAARKLQALSQPDNTPLLRVSRLLHDSVTDGPGLRYVVFVQGCPHRCPHCHNPDTHNPAGGRALRTEDILADIRRNPILNGVTFSGGEPFAQAVSLILLAERLEALCLPLWIYTGYLWEELEQSADMRRLRSLAEVVVDGRFDITRQSYDLPWRGSANQRLIDVRRSLAAGQAVEREG